MQQRLSLSAVIFVALLVMLIAGPMSFSSNSVAAVPVFTGDVPADFTGEAVIRIDDPSSGIGVPDVGLPMPPFADDRVSGWDMHAVYMEYDFATDVLYVGIDCFGICSDADGDGDPGATGPELASLAGTDLADLSSTEAFTFLIDTDNNCESGTDADFEVVVGVAVNSNVSAFGAYSFVGDPFNPSAGFGDALSNGVTLFAAPSAETPDLEFSIADFSTLPGFNFTPGDPFNYQINVFMGSLEDDGIGEDYLPGAAQCVPVVPPMPTPTPTHTPTETPVPTETPTPTPPSTATPPPPTQPPITGPNGSEIPNASTEIMGIDAVAAPEWLRIPAIGVDTIVEPMGWYSSVDASGKAFSQWQVIDNAAGWHANSALPFEHGNVVLSGHNTIGGSVFRDLDQLQTGDNIFLWQAEELYVYTVSQTVIVPELYASPEQHARNAAYLKNFGDDRLTLISCWPDDSNEYRVIVIAHRLGLEETLMR